MSKSLSGVSERSLLLSMRLVLGGMLFAFVGLNDGAVGVLIPSMQGQYGVDKAVIALLFLSGSAGYLTAAFLSGPLFHQLGRQRLLMLGTFLFMCGAVGVSQLPPFVVLVPLFFPIGFGAATLDAGFNAYVASLPKSASRLNYLHAFYGIGAFLGPTIASAALVLGFAWNTVYMLWGCVGLLLFVGIFFAFRGRDDSTHADTSEQGSTLLAALSSRIVWVAAIFLLIYVGLEVSLGTWCYSYLTQYRNLAPLFSGWANGAYWLGLALGRLLLGGFIHRIGERRAIQSCIVGVCIGVAVTWLVPSSLVAALGLCWIGFCLGPLFPTVIALMPQLVSARILASAIGFLASLGSMGGAIFPWLAGNLVQYLGLWMLMPYAVVLTLLMLLTWLLLYRSPQVPRIARKVVEE